MSDLQEIEALIECDVNAALTRLAAHQWLNEPRAYAIWAKALHRAGRLAEAAAKARQLATDFKGHPEVRYQSAAAFFWIQDYATAARDCRAAFTADPTHVKALRLLGECLRHQGDHRGAVVEFARVLETRPDYLEKERPEFAASYCNGWGNALYALRRYADAREKYERATRLDNSVEVYWNNVGAATYACEEWYAAVLAYRTAAALGGDLMTLSGLGLAEWRAGLVRDAEATFARAEALAENAFSAEVNHCSCLWRAGRYHEARIEAHAMRERYRYAAKSNLAPYDLTDAGEIFARILGDYTVAEEALTYAATTRETPFERAERHLTHATILYARAEQEPELRRRLAPIAAGHCHTAAHAILSDLDAHPGEAVESASLLAGRAFFLLGNYTEATKHFSNAMQRRAPTTDTLLGYALVCARQKDHAGCLRALDAAERSDPEDVATRVLLADALLRAGDLDRAETEIRRAIATAPQTVEAHMTLASIAIEQGEKGDAEAYQQALAELDTAWQLAGAVIGSRPFTPTLGAQICYLRGFIRTRLYDQPTVLKKEALLQTACADFRKALSFDPFNHRAQAAVRKIDARLSAPQQSWASERFVGTLCGVLSVATFIAAWARFARGDLDAGYAVLFLFGAMVFLIASFYLPVVVKLKIAGIELEKGSHETAVSKLPLQIRPMPSA
jgi:tetratricopeptide (TPR) repeat protein